MFLLEFLLEIGGEIVFSQQYPRLPPPEEPMVGVLPFTQAQAILMIIGSVLAIGLAIWNF